LNTSIQGLIDKHGEKLGS